MNISESCLSLLSISPLIINQHNYSTNGLCPSMSTEPNNWNSPSVCVCWRDWRGNPSLQTIPLTLTSKNHYLHSIFTLSLSETNPNVDIRMMSLIRVNKYWSLHKQNKGWRAGVSVVFWWFCLLSAFLKWYKTMITSSSAAVRAWLVVDVLLQRAELCTVGAYLMNSTCPRIRGWTNCGTPSRVSPSAEMKTRLGLPQITPSQPNLSDLGASLWT